MKSAMAYEFMRIRTIRSSWVLTAICLSATVFAAVGMTVKPASGSNSPTGLLGDQAALAAVLTAPAQATPLMMGLLGVFAFGHEYRYGTIRSALCVLPRRTTLATAKVLVVALWSAAVAMIGIALSALVLALLGGGRFQPATSLTAGSTPRVALGVVVYVALYALTGLAFGWIFRNGPAAVTLLLVLPLLVEPLLRLLLSSSPLRGVAEVGQYLPYGAGARLFSYSTPIDPKIAGAFFSSDLSPLAGGLTMGAATAGLLAVAHMLFQRRDA